MTTTTMAPLRATHRRQTGGAQVASGARAGQAMPGAATHTACTAIVHVPVESYGDPAQHLVTFAHWSRFEALLQMMADLPSEGRQYKALGARVLRAVDAFQEARRAWLLERWKEGRAAA